MDPKLLKALEGVEDPELGYSIVGLGLVYDAALTDDGTAELTLTMTTPGCPATDMILDQVRASVASLPGVERVEVHLVWDPPWTPDLMSEDARRVFGFAPQAT